MVFKLHVQCCKNFRVGTIIDQFKKSTEISWSSTQYLTTAKQSNCYIFYRSTIIPTPVENS